jgi:transcriptional regulator GlxA family with amidase domain
MTTRIGIALFDGAEELDWAGPWEVLSYWAHRKPEDDVEVFTVARDNSRPIQCAKGLRVLADHSWSSAPDIDVLVFPGGDMSAQVGDEDVRTWVRSIHERARLTTSVCTGAWVLADAGLLRDRPATTHWDDFDGLLAIDGTIEPRRDEPLSTPAT